MMKRTLMAAAVAATLGLSLGAAFAADDPAPIYGSQLMTEQERLEYRNTLRNAKTSEEREQFRQQHHERMLLRAKEKGVILPDVPPATGGGMGPGSAGQGPGGAMMIPPGGKAR
jgi:hypothetical protein